jgi:predicted DNA binding protein
LKVKVLKVMKLRSQGKILTEKQERVLWLALKTGLFDYPRKVDMVEFSRKLGISSSTLSEVIRRGIRRLLEHHFEAL